MALGRAASVLGAAAVMPALAWAAAELYFGVKETYGDRGRGRTELNEPWDVCISSGGEVAVLDKDRGAVVLFSQLGTWLRTLGDGAGATPELELDRPRAIASKDGHLWVVDTGNHRVVVLDGNGAVWKVVGSLGSTPGRFRLPADLTFDRGDKVYVADSGNERIQVFRLDGKFEASWDRRTKQRQDRIVRLVSVAYSDYGRGSIWVVNENTPRLERLAVDRGGEWDGAVDLASIAEGAVRPERIEIEPAFYRMFVTDSAGERVLVVSRKGDLLAEIRDKSERARAPGGLAVTRLLDVFVTEPFGKRVVWYSKKPGS